MQQIPRLLNPWLLSYIKHHRRVESRYQIDQVLLKAGYDAGEIEAIWEALKDEPILPREPSPRPPTGRFLFVLASLSALVALVCMFVAPVSPASDPSLAQRDAAFYLPFMLVALLLISGLNLTSFYLSGKGRRLDGCVFVFFHCYSLTFVLIGCLTNFWNAKRGIINFADLLSVSNLLTISLLTTALFSFMALRRQSKLWKR